MQTVYNQIHWCDRGQYGKTETIFHYVYIDCRTYTVNTDMDIYKAEPVVYNWCLVQNFDIDMR